MKIIIIADTHLPSNKRGLPDVLIRACKQADLIIHAGDWNELEVFEELSLYAKVVGVYGNVDSTEVKQVFPQREIIEAGGYRIGVTHGHGTKKTTEKRALEAFEEEKVDIIIFGHSHIPMIRYVGNVLLINPGSPTYKRKVPQYSFGVMEIEKSINVRLVFFN
ncbi:metallophosphoesterase [Pseudogracilibacillus sp. SE30717A]|uniref:metallophosphoesterase family protein n=1 Tax=Pseudogracilibacillus sp. SE30717A TaxID=3098293 RepID=UPI00300E0AF6